MSAGVRLFRLQAFWRQSDLDCGPIGPDYQPGHAHCDTLSFELCVDGQRVVVDSGVHDYDVGPQRAYDRSTGAHNTVMVDGVEQSEIWGFRVARRARPLFAELSEWSNGELRFQGSHDGYHRIRGRVRHEREFSFNRRVAGRFAIVSPGVENTGFRASCTSIRVVRLSRCRATRGESSVQTNFH
ncbi:MAG: heparinase II/III-family protein [Proteobacteria bacterium]|nr:heparinase II/III-family protein [Pseudomonadota bacterium]